MPNVWRQRRAKRVRCTPGLGLRWEVDGVPAGLQRLERRELRVERTAPVGGGAAEGSWRRDAERMPPKCKEVPDEEAVYGGDAVKDEWRLRGLDASPEDAREAGDDCPPEAHPDDDEYAPTENGR